MIIVKKLFFILSIAIATLLSSCSDSAIFSAKGKVEDVGSQNMRVIYYSNDAVTSIIVPIEYGQFNFEAEIKAPSLLEFYTANKSLLARAYVDPSDKIKCHFFKGEPLKATIEGNDVSERWSAFLKQNINILEKKDVAKINALVSSYISSHKDDLLSTLLLLTEYSAIGYEDEASSLLSSIAPEARPQSLITAYEAILDRVINVRSRERLSNISFYHKNDSLSTFASHKASYSILIFSNDIARKNNEFNTKLRSLRKDYHKKRLQILDMSLDPDTAIWKKSIKSDSATWEQGWVVGSVSAHSIERLGISRLPFYIVADSTGTQLYHGTSISDTEQTIAQKLKPISKK